MKRLKLIKLITDIISPLFLILVVLLIFTSAFPCGAGAGHCGEAWGAIIAALLAVGAMTSFMMGSKVRRQIRTHEDSTDNTSSESVS